jgi:cytoskeletal protein CcmA (bactofilin family)
MTRIGASIIINGELESDEDILIEGEVRGHIHVRDAALTIGEQGRIDADVRGTRVVVRGNVQGNITATERIELGAEATMQGSLSSNRVVMVDGAHFDGTIDMQQRTIAAKMAQHRATQAVAR